MPTPLTPVTSSAIAEHGYDLATRTLAIRFRSGQRKDYLNVPPEVAERYLAHKSPGTAFHTEIRGKFSLVPVLEDDNEGSAPD